MRALIISYYGKYKPRCLNLAAPSVNSWLEDELYHQYIYDRQTVDAGWKQVFETDARLNANGHDHHALNLLWIEPPEIAGAARSGARVRWRWARTIRRCRCAVPR